MVDKSPLKLRGQGHVTHFKFWAPSAIYGTAKARVVKFYAHVGLLLFDLLS